MICSRRKTIWFVLVSYLLAGVAACFHDHHDIADEPADHLVAAAGDQRAGADRSDEAAESVRAKRHADDQDDGCAACRYLSQLSHAAPLAVAANIAPVVAPLSIHGPAELPGSIVACPHSRGPPRLA